MRRAGGTAQMCLPCGPAPDLRAPIAPWMLVEIAADALIGYGEP